MSLDLSDEFRHRQRMDLESYRQHMKLTYPQLVQQLRLSIHPSYARRVALGDAWPRPAYLNEIIVATSGVVTVPAMYERYQAFRRRAADRAA